MKSLTSFEWKCYRKVLDSQSYKQRVIQQDRKWTKFSLWQKVIERKLQLFGHICRMTDDRKFKTYVNLQQDGWQQQARPATQGVKRRHSGVVRKRHSGLIATNGDKSSRRHQTSTDSGSMTRDNNDEWHKLSVTIFFILPHRTRFRFSLGHFCDLLLQVKFWYN